MANIKISELDELVAVANDDYLPIVDTSVGETKKIKNYNLLTNKLDKSSVKGVETSSDKDVYSCNYINNKIQDIVTNGSAAKCGYKIDNHEIYVSKKNFTMDGTGNNSFSIGLQSQNITPVKYEAYIDNGSSIFQANTPRANGTEVDITQLFTYWNYASDKFIATSNGFDRTGTIVQVYFYFYYN